MPETELPDVRAMIKHMPRGLSAHGRGYWFVLEDLTLYEGETATYAPYSYHDGPWGECPENTDKRGVEYHGPQSNHDVQRRIMAAIAHDYGDDAVHNADGSTAEAQWAELDSGTVAFDSEGSAFGASADSYVALLELMLVVESELRGAAYERAHALTPGHLCDGRYFDADGAAQVDPERAGGPVPASPLED